MLKTFFPLPFSNSCVMSEVYGPLCRDMPQISTIIKTLHWEIMGFCLDPSEVVLFLFFKMPYLFIYFA